MVVDYIRYNKKRYQVSTVCLNGVFETMIFPIENDTVLGEEVYMYRTCATSKSLNKHKNIIDNIDKYVSEAAIEEYLKSKEKCCENIVITADETKNQ